MAFLRIRSPFDDLLNDIGCTKFGTLIVIDDGMVECGSLVMAYRTVE